MNLSEIQLNSDHKKCIISLINKIIAKSPHLTELKSDSVLFSRLVSVVNLIESTLCSKYQIALKRNSTDSQSIHLIKSWLQQYYSQHLITCLATKESQIEESVDESQSKSMTEVVAENNSESNVTSDDKSKVEKINNNLIEYSGEDIDRDIGLIALLILFIAHKLRQSLPRINAYFSPEWQRLSEFDQKLNEILNFDKLLDLIQNELCIKRKQLEMTKSKVLSLQSTLNSRSLEQMRENKSKLDYRSNLFAEYEDNDEEVKRFTDSEPDQHYMSEESEGSAVFVDHSSDDDYEPKNKSQKVVQKTSSIKRSSKVVHKSRRGRGRPSKNSLKSSQRKIIRSGKSRGRPPKADSNSMSATEGEGDTPFVCDICGKQFAKEYRLNRHSFTHLGHKQFVCDFPECDQSFDLKWKLSEHKSEHNCGEEEDDSLASFGHSFECEWADCGLVFPSKRELTGHEHEMHANRSQSKYSCDWPKCREIFENKIDWRKHVRTHGKITPTECGFPGCSKTFYKLDSLENHRKIHETFTLEELS